MELRNKYALAGLLLYVFSTIFVLYLALDNQDAVADPELAIHLYRIAQEAVANAAKHGRATEVILSLGSIEVRVELTVEDNGTGLPPDFTGGSGGMGLRVMQYRAGLIGGTLHIGARAGSGVVITCAIEPVRVARPEGRPAPLQGRAQK